jgi:hypothetical protein
MEMTPEWIAAGILGLQAWQLRTTVGLKEDVAAIKATCAARAGCTESEEKENKMNHSKRQRRRFFSAMLTTVILAAACYLVMGCAGGPQLLQRGEAVHTTTNALPFPVVVTTQPPPTIENPNPPPVTVTNWETRVVETVVTNAVWTVAPETVAAIDTARAVNGLLPTGPIAPLVDSALLLALAGLGAWGKIRSRAAAAAGDKAALAGAMLKAAIAGVEAAGDGATKAAIANAAAGAGVAGQLDAEVQGVVAYITPKAPAVKP